MKEAGQNTQAHFEQAVNIYSVLLFAESAGCTGVGALLGNPGQPATAGHPSLWSAERALPQGHHRSVSQLLLHCLRKRREVVLGQTVIQATMLNELCPKDTTGQSVPSQPVKRLSVFRPPGCFKLRFHFMGADSPPNTPW